MSSGELVNTARLHVTQTVLRSAAQRADLAAGRPGLMFCAERCPRCGPFGVMLQANQRRDGDCHEGQVGRAPSGVGDVAAGANFAVVLGVGQLISEQSIWNPGPCRPVTERSGELGCWIVATEALVRLPKAPVFWRVYVYPTRITAEVRPGATIVESLGKVWLLRNRPGPTGD